jgi:two-component system phosphate regulon sensor histidine kinase PhoR
MKRSIFLKLFGSTFLVLMFMAVLFLLISFRSIQRTYEDGLAADLEKIGRALEFQVVRFLGESGPAEGNSLEAFFREFGRTHGIRLTFIQPDGTVLADSEEDPGTMENHRFRPEVISALSGTTGRSLRFSRTMKLDMLYIGLPVSREGQILGCLRVSTFIRDIQVMLSGFRRNVAWTTVLVAALALLVAFLVARGFSRTVHRINVFSREIAEGKFGAKIYLRRRDELGRLGASLNQMSEKIGELFAEATARREELQGAVTSMQEGLMVIDGVERIALANPAFQRIIGSPGPLEGHYFWEVVRSSAFQEFMREVRQDRCDRTESVAIGGRTYLCRAVCLSQERGVLVTFNDMTEVEELARRKKELVVNVSHELRTPLTAIKGYAEMLEAAGDQPGRDYAGIIRRNTDRLIQIVEDLLVLAEAEEIPQGSLDEKVDLRAILDQTVTMFRPKVEAKSLTLGMEVEPGLPSVQGDAFRLEQMVINLLDNALKYTDQGGIMVRLAASEGQVTLTVEDSGIGIPREEQSRIFERFYVVDKSRSRRLGGTGLGLAIVKHIVQLHRGTVRVKSELGGGSTFEITLPAWPSPA